MRNMSKLVEAQRELRKQANAPIPDRDILRMLGHEQEKSKNLFSALRAHNECRASFALNKKSLAPLGPAFWKDVLRLKDAVRDNDDFYSEFLHAYLQSPFYISRDRELGELFWSINNQFIKHSNNAYYDSTVDMYNLVRTIRNEVILENWDKYRKAYIFDIELEKAFLNIKNGEISASL